MNKQEILDYIEKTNFDIQSAHAAIFTADLAYSSYANSRVVHGADFSPVFCYISYTSLVSHFQFIDLNLIHGIGRHLFNNYQADKNYIDKMISKHKFVYEEIKQLWAKYDGLDFLNMPKDDLLQFYTKMIELAKQFWIYTAIGEDKGHVIETEIVPRFSKRHNLSIDKAREIVNILYHPEEQTKFNIERSLFLVICLDIINNSYNNLGEILTDDNIIKKVDSYIEQFFWMKTGFYKAEIITRESLLKDALKEIKLHPKQDLAEELDNIKTNFKKIHDKKETIDIKLESEDKSDINFAKSITYWVDFRKEGMMGHLYYALILLENIAKRFDLPYKDIALYKIKEVEDLIRYGKKLDKAILEKRYESTFLVLEEGKDSLFYNDPDAKELFEAANHVDIKEIKGMIASVGTQEIILGEVNIVNNQAKEIFEPGKILVTSMTRPEFVPMMRRAKAVITNEGGIACHAAIVSRELGIPCIIGTKAATKVLKNGDKVEMDMKTGIVKVIK